MKCGKCGTELPPNASFCPVCGNQMGANPGQMPPQSQFQPQSHFQPPQAPINTWLVPAILATIFCCLPFGIVSIIFASKANSSLSIGDFQQAQEMPPRRKPGSGSHSAAGSFPPFWRSSFRLSRQSLWPRIDVRKIVETGVPLEDLGHCRRFGCSGWRGVRPVSFLPRMAAFFPVVSLLRTAAFVLSRLRIHPGDLLSAARRPERCLAL